MTKTASQKLTTRLSAKHVKALAYSIIMHAQWKGELKGHYSGDAQSILDETERLALFDSHVALSREALRIIKTSRRTHAEAKQFKAARKKLSKLETQK